MELSKRSTRIKELVSELNCIGTVGLVELELIGFDKEITELKQQRDELLEAVQESSDDLNFMLMYAKKVRRNDVKIDLGESEMIEIEERIESNLQAINRTKSNQDETK